MQNFSIKKEEAIQSLGNPFRKKARGPSFEEMIERIIKRKPFGDRKFYIQCFLKNTEILNEKKMWFYPRLTAPEMVPNCSLYRIDPKKPDQVEIIWILPGIEAFDLFGKGKMYEDAMIDEFIQEYKRKTAEEEKIAKEEVDRKKELEAVLKKERNKEAST